MTETNTELTTTADQPPHHHIHTICSKCRTTLDFNSTVCPCWLSTSAPKLFDLATGPCKHCVKPRGRPIFKDVETLLNKPRIKARCSSTRCEGCLRDRGFRVGWGVRGVEKGLEGFWNRKIHYLIDSTEFANSLSCGFEKLLTWFPWTTTKCWRLKSSSTKVQSTMIHIRKFTQPKRTIWPSNQSLKPSPAKKRHSRIQFNSQP
jgi:hypothetical protein